ncbi:DUF4913 domain-containing protein [Nocardiopsis trehalosi]|jgi:hypothetical protein|uniref:DUF4913 domain-containing protein n=1 Tax=Nocardiopsis trehalosi TaxID=109329 RepID=UPI0009FF26BF|nr:DUF4913 domain-containing protein [Nocardiopsis trehalosi]
MSTTSEEHGPVTEEEDEVRLADLYPDSATDGEYDPELEEDDGGAADDGADRKPVFKNVEEFVTYRFIPMYSRPEGGQFRWCREWWRHPEAVSRFHALWHAWEVLRWEPGTGMAVWYRDHLDYQMTVLMGDTGPFRECTSRRHQDPRPLPADPAPEGWFEDEW